MENKKINVKSELEIFLLDGYGFYAWILILGGVILSLYSNFYSKLDALTLAFSILLISFGLFCFYIIKKHRKKPTALLLKKLGIEKTSARSFVHNKLKNEIYSNNLLNTQEIEIAQILLNYVHRFKQN